MGRGKQKVALPEDLVSKLSTEGSTFNVTFSGAAKARAGMARFSKETVEHGLGLKKQVEEPEGWKLSDLSLTGPQGDYEGDVTIAFKVVPKDPRKVGRAKSAPAPSATADEPSEGFDDSMDMDEEDDEPTPLERARKGSGYAANY